MNRAQINAIEQLAAEALTESKALHAVHSSLLNEANRLRKQYGLIGEDFAAGVISETSTPALTHPYPAGTKVRIADTDDFPR